MKFEMQILRFYLVEQSRKIRFYTNYLSQFIIIMHTLTYSKQGIHPSSKTHPKLGNEEISFPLQ